MDLLNAVISLCLLCMTPHSSTREFHYSFWSDNPRPYLEAIQKSNLAAPLRLSTGQNIRAGILTHHFLASSLMVRFFDGLRAQPAPETVVLIGPNHFHHSRRDISISSLPWKTPFGILDTDRAIIEQIKTATHLTEDSEAFTGEHSVGVLIPFIKYYFPRCRVVPILIDVNADENQLTQLRGLLSGLLEKPALLVLLSMDFSHHSEASTADSRDRQAQEAIAVMDPRRVDSLHVDCHKGLRLLMESLRDLGHVSVKISEHTNSAELTGNFSQTDVTSYFSVYFIYAPKIVG
jgi:hypothetical protein